MAFEIGDVVCVISHPYFENLTNIVISGEHQQLPPLMAVTEILKKKSVEGENEIICKCLWYSGKTSRFQDNWFSADFLRKIVSEKSEWKITRGSLVVLNTLGIELGKKRSALTVDETTDSRAITTISALLTYVSPVMYVLDVLENKPKPNEPLRDKKGLKERQIPATLIKCQWYSSHHEKYVEAILPIEVIDVCEAVNEKFLENLQAYIKRGQHLLYTKEDQSRLVRPSGLSFRSGKYILRAYDLVLNSITELSVNNEEYYKRVRPFLIEAPDFDSDSNDESIALVIENQFLDLIQNAIGRNTFLRLKYKNRNDKLTTRTIHNYELIERDENGRKYFFLSGYCNLRREKRTFRVQRIQHIAELNLQFKRD